MKRERNSFLELFRFIFSLFILFYHNLFFIRFPIFGNANYFVDFFFMVSGLFLIPTVSKYDQYSLKEGTKLLLKDRLKNLWIPLSITSIFVFVSWIMDTKFLFKARLLWFVLLLLLIYFIYYLIRRLVKSDKKFIVIISIIGGLALLARFMGVININNKAYTEVVQSIFEIDELRGFSCVAIGVIISKLPDIKFKDENTLKDFLYIVFAASIIIIGLSLYTSSLGFYGKLYTEIVVDLIAFPTMVYASRFYRFSNKTIDILGNLSIYIYIYQQIPYTLGGLNIKSRFLLFLMVLVPVLIHLYFIVKNEKKKERQRQNSSRI